MPCLYPQRYNVWLGRRERRVLGRGPIVRRRCVSTAGFVRLKNLWKFFSTGLGIALVLAYLCWRWFWFSGEYQRNPGVLPAVPSITVNQLVTVNR